MASRNPVITLSPSPPPEGQQGDIWINQNTGALQMHNGLFFAAVEINVIDGPLTITTGPITIQTGALVFGTAASKIIPGATSFSHRNNADSADNLLISDAGAVTVRNGFTITTGDLVPGSANNSNLGTFAAPWASVYSQGGFNAKSAAGLVLWKSDNGATGFLNLNSSSQFSFDKSITTSGTVLNFSTVASRLTADMTNGTRANRFAFQTSTANSASSIGVMPNGIGASSLWVAYDGSDPDNAGRVALSADQTGNTLNSTKSGTGTARSLAWMHDGTTRIQVDGTGIGFFATTPAAKPTVSGSKGANAALASLMTALSTLGLVTDSTS